LKNKSFLKGGWGTLPKAADRVFAPTGSEGKGSARRKTKRIPLKSSPGRSLVKRKRPQSNLKGTNAHGPKTENELEKWERIKERRGAGRKENP